MKERQLNSYLFLLEFGGLGGTWLVRTQPFAVYEVAPDLTVQEAEEIAGLPEEHLYVPPTSYVQPLLILSTRCNLRCLYCYADGGGYGLQREDMSAETVRDSMSFLERQLGGFRIQNPACSELQVGIICFGGEPLLNQPAVRQILGESPRLAARLSEKLGVHCTPLVTVNTNGMVFDGGIEGLLGDNREQLEIVVSFDGLFHDQYRLDAHGMPTAEEVTCTIGRLVRNGNKVSITCCVVPDHVPHLSESAALIRETFGESVPINFSFIRGGLGATQQTNRYPGKLERGYTMEMVEEAAQQVAQLVRDGYNIYYERFVRRLVEGGYPYRCGAYLYECCIVPDGNVYPCHNFVDEDYLLGNVSDPNFGLHPEGPVYEKFVSRGVADLGPCGGCVFRNVCLSSFDCPSHSQYDLGDFYLVDPKTCRFAKVVQAALLERFVSGLEA